MNFKLIKNIVIILISCNLYSQNIRLDYKIIYKEDSLSSETVSKNMLLLLQGNKSKFLSEKQFKVDSLRNKGNNDFAVGDTSFLVVNHEDNLSDKYYFLFKDVYKLSEYINLNWELKPETKNIDSFLCYRAVLKYKGRNWEAWFTKDLPFHAGPYVFRNLPGVIINMEDSTGSYKFILFSIKKMTNSLDIENMYANAINTSQKLLKKVFLDYYNDPFREIKLRDTKVSFKDENGKLVEPNFKEMTNKAQSLLKKNNNPIELSEAIKYP